MLVAGTPLKVLLGGMKHCSLGGLKKLHRYNASHSSSSPLTQDIIRDLGILLRTIFFLAQAWEFPPPYYSNIAILRWTPWSSPMFIFTWDLTWSHLFLTSSLCGGFLSLVHLVIYYTLCYATFSIQCFFAASISSTHLTYSSFLKDGSFVTSQSCWV